MSLKTLMLELGIVGSFGLAYLGLEVENGRGVSLVDEAMVREEMRRENMITCSMAVSLMDGGKECKQQRNPVQGPSLGRD
jgi:hypothetical protein